MPQLLLWEEAKEEKEEKEGTPIPDFGETIEYTNPGWADGDTSPTQLERLARILLRPGLRIEVFKLPKGMYLDGSSDVWFQTIATRIEKTQVIQTLQRIKPLIGGYADNPEDDEEEQ